MTFNLAAMILAATAAQEMIDHPQYAHWKSCKPGSWVKHKMVMDAGGRVIETERLATLVEVTAEKAVLEVKTTMNMGGRKMDMPSQKEEVAAQIDSSATRSCIAADSALKSSQAAGSVSGIPSCPDYFFSSATLLTFRKTLSFSLSLPCVTSPLNTLALPTESSSLSPLAWYR